MTENIYSHTCGPMPYLEAGKGEAILFLHSAFATPHPYSPLFSLLSERFRVIAPTHPGHGKAFGISSEWTYEDFVRVYRQFLGGISFAPRCIIGHSFGGALAVSLASEMPCVPVIALDPAGLPFSFSAASVVGSVIREGEDALQKNPDLQTVRELVGSARSLAVTMMKHPENIPWFYHHAAVLDLTKTFRTLSNQVALFWGEKDCVVPLSVGMRMQTYIPNATLTVLPELGHDYSILYPEFTYGHILTALSLFRSGGYSLTGRSA